MAISADRLFPKWIAEYYALFPPVVFFIAVMFGWGLFFEIDQRLMFILSFADFLKFFVVFISVAIILILALIGFTAPILRRWSPWIVKRELRASFILRILMIALMIGSSLLPGRLNIYAGILTGIVVFLMFIVPALSAYQNGEVDRFRAAVLISLFGVSWMVMASGQLAGRTFVDGPKRVYLIRLQDKSDTYANIVLYLSNGIVYKVGKEIFYSPNDALLFTRRTGFRREM